ncbi:MAG: hypothetical protein M1823_004555 [Watsoniomyces obsoletus]|nr:MAG: hypothetical protein M1823_004555 [Watsoniomyces obsoletus]
MQAFVPKNRRPKFELRLKILDLNNVPLVSGTCYVKWHLPSSTSTEHRGRTTKAIIKDHKVQWDYEKVLLVRLTVDKNGMLQESEILFEVLQEVTFGVRGERVLLGNVRLNLAEYVEGGAAGPGVGLGVAGAGRMGVVEDDEGIARRYLMQESRINSTLKICIGMKQIEGDRNFFAPPLKSAQVFGGIAGIISNNEQTEQDDIGHINQMSFKTTETRELQDMYRRTLAASFAAQAGELPADECIESIFSGGDGWRHDPETGLSMHNHTELQHSLSSSSSSPFSRKGYRRGIESDRSGGGGQGGSLSTSSSTSSFRRRRREFFHQTGDDDGGGSNSTATVMGDGDSSGGGGNGGNGGGGQQGHRRTISASRFRFRRKSSSALNSPHGSSSSLNGGNNGGGGGEHGSLRMDGGGERSSPVLGMGIGINMDLESNDQQQRNGRMSNSDRGISNGGDGRRRGSTSVGGTSSDGVGGRSIGLREVDELDVRDHLRSWTLPITG